MTQQVPMSQTTGLSKKCTMQQTQLPEKKAWCQKYCQICLPPGDIYRQKFPLTMATCMFLAATIQAAQAAATKKHFINIISMNVQI